MQNYDAIVVPGAGLIKNGKPSPWMQNRLDLAVELYSGEPIIPLSAGTVRKPWPVDENGFHRYESSAAADYLVAQGIDYKKIWCDFASLDTIGNFFFLRIMHTEPRNLKHLLIIASEFHMPRVSAITKWVFGYNPPSGGYSFDFKTVPDIGLAEEELNARQAKEKKSLADILQVKQRLSTWQDFHEWLFTEHKAYSAGQKPSREVGKILESY
ncbi:hypothetical protein GF358_00940 [Candidatus Woesearchaeota archaeon]|nr:hypothetical protein [Candidatus Woesearchaeota archaeon]